jgi:hypothetical protein
MPAKLMAAADTTDNLSLLNPAAQGEKRRQSQPALPLCFFGGRTSGETVRA